MSQVPSSTRTTYTTPTYPDGSKNSNTQSKPASTGTTAAKIAISHNHAIIYKPGDDVVSSGSAYVAVRACRAVVC